MVRAHKLRFTTCINTMLIGHVEASRPNPMAKSLGSKIGQSHKNWSIWDPHLHLHYLFVYFHLADLWSISATITDNDLPPPIINFNNDSLFYAVFKQRDNTLATGKIRKKQSKKSKPVSNQPRDDALDDDDEFINAMIDDMVTNNFSFKVFLKTI